MTVKSKTAHLTKSPAASARFRASLAASLLLPWLAACSSSGEGDTRRELLESWSTELIVPLYAQFDAHSQAVAGSLDALCTAPSDASLAAARSAWGDARAPFKQAEVFAFGPYSRPEFRIGPKLDSWPAQPDTIEDYLAGGEPVDPARLAALGVFNKGLPAIEYMLFAPDVATPARLSEPRRCEYLRSAGAELASRAIEIHVAWAPDGGNFAAQLSGAGRTSTAWRTLRDAFSEVINRMGFTLENVRRDKLGRPLGDMSGGVAVPEMAESRFSGRSIQDILDNLEGIEVLYFGDPTRNVPGVSRYAGERGRSDFDESMAGAIGAARAALEAVATPLTEAVTADPERVREASARLGQLQTLIQTELISALGLSLNFNDSDGD
jgi:predicted lipoprotein